jgi:hypothetical protein
MQGEFYTTGRTMAPGLQPFDADKARDERPEYVLLNGRLGALMDEGALGSLVVSGDERPDIFRSLSPGIAPARGRSVIGQRFYQPAAAPRLQVARVLGRPYDGPTLATFVAWVGRDLIVTGGRGMFHRHILGWVLLIVVMAASSAGALEVGEPAPEFELPSTTGADIALSDFKGKKWVFLEFYGADFAPT